MPNQNIDTFHIGSNSLFAFLQRTGSVLKWQNTAVTNQRYQLKNTELLPNYDVIYSFVAKTNRLLSSFRL